MRYSVIFYLDGGVPSYEEIHTSKASLKKAIREFYLQHKNEEDIDYDVFRYDAKVRNWIIISEKIDMDF